MEKYYTKYFIVKYDYVTKRNISLDELFTDKFTALNMIFSIALNYLQSQDGYEKIKNIDKHQSFMFSKSQFDSAFKKTLTPGHYIIRDSDDHVYKLEIWRKSLTKIPGKVYGDWVKSRWKKVFDLDMIEMSGSIINSICRDSDNSCWLKSENNVPISKSDLEMASKSWKKLNDNIIKLGCFKKLQEKSERSKIEFAELRAEFGAEFALFQKKSKIPDKLSSESIIFERSVEGTLNTYKVSPITDDKKLKLKKIEIKKPGKTET